MQPSPNLPRREPEAPVSSMAAKAPPMAAKAPPAATKAPEPDEDDDDDDEPMASEPKLKRADSFTSLASVASAMVVSDDVQGSLQVSLEYTAGAKKAKNQGTVRVAVAAARDLLAKEPYVKLYLSKNGKDVKTTKQKSKPVKGANPVFNHVFTVDIPQRTEMDDLTRIQLTVWDHARIRANECKGGMSFSLRDLVSTPNLSGWFSLLPYKDGRNNFERAEAIPDVQPVAAPVQPARTMPAAPTSPTRRLPQPGVRSLPAAAQPPAPQPSPPKPAPPPAAEEPDVPSSLAERMSPRKPASYLDDDDDGGKDDADANGDEDADLLDDDEQLEDQPEPSPPQQLVIDDSALDAESATDDLTAPPSQRRLPPAAHLSSLDDDDVLDDEPAPARAASPPPQAPREPTPPPGWLAGWLVGAN